MYVSTSLLVYITYKANSFDERLLHECETQKKETVWTSQLDSEWVILLVFCLKSMKQ